MVVKKPSLRSRESECAAVVGHFDRSSREGTQRKVEELHRQARQIVTMLHQEGKRPSFKRVNAFLGKAVSQNWRERSAAIRAARADSMSAESWTEELLAHPNRFHQSKALQYAALAEQFAALSVKHLQKINLNSTVSAVLKRRTRVTSNAA